jgi:hypothetical protein
MSDCHEGIFVFGSNLAGRHGKGAALHAYQRHKAKYGVGEGRTGDSYAIPTKDRDMKVRPLNRINLSVLGFIDYAFNHPELRFFVTAIGTGLAGYTHEEIAPFFKKAPDNCLLPTEWIETYRRRSFQKQLTSIYG